MTNSQFSLLPNATQSRTALPSFTSPITNSSISNVTYMNTTDPLVQYVLECPYEESLCNKVGTSIRAAIDQFTEVVNVKNSLLIKVKYSSFCKDYGCANDSFGWGLPSSQFILPFEDGADLNFIYPQALAKQLAPYSSTSVWAKYDILIKINHDVHLRTIKSKESETDEVLSNGVFWFFNNSYSPPIKPHQIDFRYIVLHELIHGFGFLSSWAAYFWAEKSPFRMLVDGVIDPLELQLVTPFPYWFITEDTGPTYVTGFQPTTIFDKFLVNIDTELNVTSVSQLSDLAFGMQNFCVQDSNAFIVNFIRGFNAANQSTMAHKLWLSMSQPETLIFKFQSPTIANSSYNLIPYLNQTYKSMTLLTGGNIFSAPNFAYPEVIMNRPGIMISHLDNQYWDTVDFLMTQKYHKGKRLEELVNHYYKKIPIIKYNTTVSSTNLTIIEKRYMSPIGPGILRILDSMGYSTVLTKTNYTTDGNVKTPKSRSLCDDSNTNHGLKPTPSSTSHAIKLHNNILLIISALILSIKYNMK
ncbi:uncharacterized protein BX663DRAFT_425424 [Cokeromyces recurvatus]|uniref:uncharacterized protein n=1 Tax=Cokeromyces recurvatus TaxID=90255 RepID=UPI00221FDBBE|nr:uncharacterized protein BX663DRAFT_425424 [Cokeromyces recurvatus]KAI7908320.1 hypothetical protein BX663DRAFT_425424 [Cokeromyces recurvatus]